jgi:hypothetical protein
MTACIIMHNMIIEDEKDLGRIESPYERGQLKLGISFHMVRHQILCHLLKSMTKFATLRFTND